MTLTGFLLARIAEDEERADLVHRYDCDLVYYEITGDLQKPCDCGWPARVLAECEAKRRIVEAYRSAEIDHGYWSRRPGTDGEATSRARFAAWSHALTLLALSYADHPDCDPAWRP